MKNLIKHDQFEPMKLIAVTERLRAWTETGGFDSALTQVREDIKWLLDSHLYYYQALERVQKALLYRKNGDYEQTWQDRVEELEAELKELRNE